MDFDQALKAEVGGRVEDNRWTCACGESGEAASETAAALTLYLHRRSGHREVVVTFPS